MQKRARTTRRRFLEATLQSLAENGYTATTTQEVCRRAGASRGTLLHHFATREELIIEAVEYILGENVRHFTQTMTGLADPRQQHARSGQFRGRGWHHAGGPARYRQEPGYHVPGRGRV